MRSARTAHRIHGKDGTLQARQLVDLLLKNVRLVGGHCYKHHQGEIRGTEASGHRLAHVATGLNDEARHVRHDPEAIGTGRVDDQIDVGTGGKESRLVMRDGKMNV